MFRKLVKEVVARITNNLNLKFIKYVIKKKHLFMITAFKKIELYPSSSVPSEGKVWMRRRKINENPLPFMD